MQICLKSGRYAATNFMEVFVNKILEMRAKRAKLWDAAKAFLDTHRAEDGTMSAEDSGWRMM